MASNNDGASSRRLVLDDLVGGMESFLLVRGTELGSEVVGSDGAEVGSRSGGENVLSREITSISRRICSRRGRADLSGPGSVLGGSTSDVDDFVVLLEVGVAISTFHHQSRYFFRWLARSLAGTRHGALDDGLTSRTGFLRRGRRRWP